MAGLIAGWSDTYQSGAGSSFSHQVPAGNNISAGDLVIVPVAWFDNVGTGLTISSVSDGTANTYTLYGAYTRSTNIAGGQINIGVFICDSAANSATQPTFTITLSSAESGGIGAGFATFTNQNATPRDQISTGVLPSPTTSATCNALTTAAANELVVAFGAEDISGFPRTAPTFTGSTPDANYATLIDCPNNSSSQDLLVAIRGSSTDANGQIGSGVSTAPRFNAPSSQSWVLDHLLLAAAAKSLVMPTHPLAAMVGR